MINWQDNLLAIPTNAASQINSEASFPQGRRRSERRAGWHAGWLTGPRPWSAQASKQRTGISRLVSCSLSGREKQERERKHTCPSARRLIALVRASSQVVSCHRQSGSVWALFQFLHSILKVAARETIVNCKRTAVKCGWKMYADHTACYEAT